MHKFNTILVTMFMSLPSLSFAVTPTKDPLEGVKIFGYIDASYNYLDSNNQFTSETFDRSFDIQEDGLTLQQEALSLAYQPEKGLGGLANVILGRDALITAAYGYNPDIRSDHIGFDILQLFMQYATSSFTLIGGKYVTLASAEVVDTTSDTNFSRSLLYTFATPITHLGVRGTYAFNDKLKFIFGVNNGWDSIRDTGRGKTLEFGVAYNPCAKIAILAQAYSGEEPVIARTATGPTGRRNLIDFVATYNPTDKLTLATNYDYGTQSNVIIDEDGGATSKVSWQGLAAYLNYKFNDTWRLSTRSEIFSDRNGYRTGVEQTIKELTFTVGFAPIKNLEFRGETRRDISNTYSYVDRHSGNPRKIQQSYALEAVYKFNNTADSSKNASIFPVQTNLREVKTPNDKKSLKQQKESSISKDHFTLQLVGSSNEENVKQFIMQYGLQTKAHYIHTNRGGKDWYVVVYGDYPSVHIAKKAISTLPDAVRHQFKPWIRNLNAR